MNKYVIMHLLAVSKALSAKVRYFFKKSMTGRCRVTAVMWLQSYLSKPSFPQQSVLSKRVLGDGLPWGETPGSVFQVLSKTVSWMWSRANRDCSGMDREQADKPAARLICRTPRLHSYWPLYRLPLKETVEEHALLVLDEGLSAEVLMQVSDPWNSRRG